MSAFGEWRGLGFLPLPLSRNSAWVVIESDGGALPMPSRDSLGWHELVGWVEIGSDWNFFVNDDTQAPNRWFWDGVAVTDCQALDGSSILSFFCWDPFFVATIVVTTEVRAVHAFFAYTSGRSPSWGWFCLYLHAWPNLPLPRAEFRQKNALLPSFDAKRVSTGMSMSCKSSPAASRSLPT